MAGSQGGGLAFRGGRGCGDRGFFGSWECVPALTREIPENQPAGDAAEDEQKNAAEPMFEDEHADAEHGGVYEDAAADPVHEIRGEVADLRKLGALFCD